MRSASAKRRRAHRHDHELLEVDGVVRVRAAVEHVHHRDRQHVRRLAAEVAPQRQVLLGGGRARGRERDAEDRVRAQARLVRRAVELDQLPSRPSWSVASWPATASAISPLTLPTAFVTPLPP